ncbi:MAG: YqhA family protein [Anaerolineales bacterium]|nr:YqhA family protein [Anaerolineales bacterium]
MGRLLEKTGYLAYIGIISLLLASVVAFGWGAVKTFNAIMLIITSYGKDSSIAVSLIEIVDSFLIAIALQIFSVSMYELFVGKLNLPDWMLAHNLHELKTKLSSVIVLVMAVKFLERLVEWKNPNDLLFFAIAISVVAAALIAFSYFGKKD